MRLALASIACVPWMQGCSDAPTIELLRSPLSAYCTATVVGKGAKDVETDYLPHVVACENGNADTEALKAQAVAARTFLYYKKGTVQDGTSDQVYTCSTQPSQKHYEAVTATSGQVLVYSGVVICSFFVAGAKPSTAGCVAAAGDPDPTSTSPPPATRIRRAPRSTSPTTRARAAARSRRARWAGSTPRTSTTAAACPRTARTACR
jgi:SpoIID/LytB domain protein